MDITDKQLEAYNKKDLQTFMDCYTDSIIVSILSGKILTNGKLELEKIMANSFEKEKYSTSKVLTKIIQGNLIINQEEITGHANTKTIKTISIYEVENNLIQKLWFGGRTED